MPSVRQALPSRRVMLISFVLGLGCALPASADWLDLRRLGVPAELAAARKVGAPEPWIAEYVADLPPSHPLAGLRITVARAPGATGKATASKPPAKAAPVGPPVLSSVIVRFDGPAKLRGVGVVAHGGKIWLRLPGGKPTPMTNPALFQDLPGLGLPLAVFVASETEGLFDLRNEGEFDDVAILRLTPRYEKGPGLQPMKIGMSKQYNALVLGEVTDRDGKALGGVIWLDTHVDDGLAVHDHVRLRPANAVEGAGLGLRLDSLRRGKKTGKLVFGPAALR